MRRRSPRTAVSGGRRADTATVVIGIDGSPASWGAFSWACGEASRVRSRAVAVFASSTAGSSMAAIAAAANCAPIDCSATDRAAAEQAEQLLAQMRLEARGFDFAFIHAPGDPVAALLRVAEEGHADLIVVGQSNKTRHGLGSSVGQRLIARRPRPVIVIVP